MPLTTAGQIDAQPPIPQFVGEIDRRAATGDGPALLKSSETGPSAGLRYRPRRGQRHRGLRTSRTTVSIAVIVDKFGACLAQRGLVQIGESDPSHRLSQKRAAMAQANAVGASPL